MRQKILIVAMAGFCFSASAQWQWIDKDGRRVFSDRAPPADILDKNIVKRPAGRTFTRAPQADTDVESASSSASIALPVDKASGMDKDLELKKKKADDAEIAKRKADEERITRARIENCARAKQAKATYESGIPVARTNVSGQREVLDDAARAAELRRLQGIMESDCK